MFISYALDAHVSIDLYVFCTHISIAATADAALKIASSRQGFADTDIYLEMVGFDQADIRRIKAQESRARGMMLLEEIENETVEEELE